MCALVAMTANALAYDYNFRSGEGEGAIYYKLNSPVAGEATVVAGEWQYRDNVVIPDEITDEGGITYKVTTIGTNAFYYCYDVISVSLGKNVKTIKTGAFTRSSGPTRTVKNKKGEDVKISGIKINIDSDSLRTIEKNAFSFTTLAPNRGSDTLAIGKNVVGLVDAKGNITTDTYFNWVTFSNISAFYVDPASPYLYTDEKGVLYSKDANNKKLKLYRFPPNSTETSYVIPSTTTTLASHAFMAMSKLTTVTGGAGLKTYGSDVLSTTVTSFPIGESVSSMPTTAFMYCTGSFYPDVDDDNPTFKLIDSVLYKYEKSTKNGVTTYDTILCQYFKIKKKLTTINH